MTTKDNRRFIRPNRIAASDISVENFKQNCLKRKAYKDKQPDEPVKRSGVVLDMFLAVVSHNFKYNKY